MKTLSLISLSFCLLSCTTKTDFYYGTWELNKENGLSTLSLSENQKINWDLSGTRIFEEVSFEAVKISPNKYNIIAGSGEDCIKLTIERLTDNVCIGCNYKCYIHENMIDEAFILRKNGALIEPIPNSKEETIILPIGYLGEFYIVYQNVDDKFTKPIQINDKGIGVSQAKPDLKQLFNAHRIFKYEGQEAIITIVNPNDYSIKMDVESEKSFNENEILIIQKGFNQSGRNDWNKKFDEDVKDNLNIEYFEIRRITK